MHIEITNDGFWWALVIIILCIAFMIGYYFWEKRHGAYEDDEYFDETNTWAWINKRNKERR